MRTILYITWNQLVRRAADRKSLVALFALPIILTLILGISLQNAFSPDFAPDPPVRVALALGEGPLPAAIGEALRAKKLEKYIRVTLYDSGEQARDATRTRSEDVTVVVPAKFPDEEIEVMGEPGSVKMSIVLDVVSGVAGSVLDPAQAAIPVEINEVEVHRSASRNPNEVPPPRRAFDYYAVGMGVLTLLFAASEGAASYAEDRKTGVYFRVRSAGTSRSTYLFGKFIGTVALGFALLLVLSLSTRLLYGVRWGDPVSWFVHTGASAIAAAGIAVLVMSLVRKPEMLEGVGGVLNNMLGFFGGSMQPTFAFPPALTRISEWMPNRWMLDGYLSILGGADLTAIASKDIRLLLVGAALFAAGWVLDGLTARAKGEV